MKNKQALFPIILFAVLALAQWLFTGNMIAEHNGILTKGKAFRFQTEPIDPSQPFIGKYIYLNYKEDHFITQRKKESQQRDSFNYGDAVFVQLDTNKDGFAVIKNVSKTPPQTGDYVEAKTSYFDTDSTGNATIHITYSFDKFYMEEYKAPKAEEAYKKANRDTAGICYTLVKVYKGNAVAQNVFINNKPISEVITK